MIFTTVLVKKYNRNETLAIFLVPFIKTLNCVTIYFRFYIIFLCGSPDFYIKYFQRMVKCNVCFCTVVLSKQLQRNFTPSTNYQEQMDFVIPPFNSPIIVPPLQYYVDGDAADRYQNAIRDLCFDLTTKMQSEYGFIKYAMQLFNKN